MPKGFINDLPILGSSDATWILREGSRPVIQGFDMIPGDADALLSIGPKTLTLEGLTVNGLYALNVVAGPNPNIKRVLLADRRWFWSYKAVYRGYNIRRNVGFKRIQDPAARPEVLGTQPKILYAAWSLRDRTPDLDPASAKWLGRQMVEDVVKTVARHETGGLGEPRVVFRDQGGLDALPVENLWIKDQGDQAIARALAYLPDAGIYVDYDATIIVYRKGSGSESSVVETAGPATVDGGNAILVSNSILRPVACDVLFTYEPEVRFDFNEASTTVMADDRYIENVLPSPDFSLVVAGETLAQGTWITFSEALTAWGPPPGFSGPLSQDDIQKCMVPFMDFWAGLEISGALNPNADWAARIAAIQLHYRRTYRINRHWMDKVKQLKAYRSATVHPSNGTRAPALAYANYSLLAGQRALFNFQRAGVPTKDFAYALNVPCYPNDDVLTITTKSSPAVVTILDADQGIIQLDYRVDPYRFWEAVLPSWVTLSDKENDLDANGFPLFAGPSGDLGHEGFPVTFDTLNHLHLDRLPKLSKNHKCSIILTAVPAPGIPNDQRQFYRVRVRPGDVQAMLPLATLQPALGPVMEVVIGEAVETARIAWNDADKSTISNLFVGEDESDMTSKITPLVLNAGSTSQSGASLQQIALAAAARIYGSLTDRYQGQKTVTMAPSITLQGWLSEVAQSLRTDGSAVTQLTLPERIQPFDLFSFLDSNARAMILRLAVPDKAF